MRAQQPIPQNRLKRFLQAHMAFASILCMTSVLSARAQGTLEFVAQLYNPYINYPGGGIFTLTGQLFTYDVHTTYGIESIEIHGPGPDGNAPLIFDLGVQRCAPPQIGLPPELVGCWTSGTVNVSEAQISELQNGDWYLWAYYSPPSIHDLSGQIVPEPKPDQLLFLSALLSCFWLAVKHRRCRFTG